MRVNTHDSAGILNCGQPDHHMINQHKSTRATIFEKNKVNSNKKEKIEIDNQLVITTQDVQTYSALVR